MIIEKGLSIKQQSPAFLSLEIAEFVEDGLEV
jgi:hypothetical protein